MNRIGAIGGICLVVVIVGLVVWRLTADFNADRQPHVTPMTSLVFMLQDGSCIRLQSMQAGLARIVPAVCPTEQR